MIKTAIRDIFLRYILTTQNNCLAFIKIFHFYLKKKIGACEKLICDIKDKEKYAVYMRALKQALNRGLKLKREHKVIQCNQKAWMKPYI